MGSLCCHGRHCQTIGCYFHFWRAVETKYSCPCCGYKTLDYEPPGTYDICRRA
ncbi:CPCC family cysteine-rich protein [Paenibacillus donghaensis]|uniref:CPCC family cysteine-rich protein n=1 Tax=Paenibacillus donghaensis TaxID=414771 RepID=UPI002AD2E67F|nr:CPCC family cysteine-rich protein [Paenibacillus donghaensis]